MNGTMHKLLLWTLEKPRNNYTVEYRGKSRMMITLRTENRAGESCTMAHEMSWMQFCDPGYFEHTVQYLINQLNGITK